MLSHHDAAKLFGSLKIVIFDELHALASSKRGDLLALDLARLRTYSPNLTAIGLSATVARPYELAAFLVPHKGQTTTRLADIVTAGEEHTFAGRDAATRSRGGSHIRASVCCSRGGSSGQAPRRSAS
jgi:Lhr-like helicase